MPRDTFGNTELQGSPVPTAPVKPVGSISTGQGVQTLNSTIAQAAKLSGAPATPAVTPVVPIGPTGEQQVNRQNGATVAAPPQTKVTLINPDTGQSVSFNDAVINKDNIQGYLGAGYHLSEAAGAIPDWLSPTGKSSSTTVTGSTTPTGNPDLDASNAALAAARKDLEEVTGKLKNFDVSNNPQLKQMLGGITTQWDLRIAQMQKAEDSRIAALNTTGLRMGSQFTGGAGGVMGGIVSAEERNAIEQIASLEASKQQALSAAQTAFESQKWTQYNDLVQSAQKSYDQQLTHVQALQKAQAEQDTKIKEAQVGATRDAGIASIYASGVKDAATILAQLQLKGDKTTTLDDVNKALKILNPPEDLTGMSADVKTFKQFYPKADLSTDAGRKEYLDWTAAVANANRKPDTAKPDDINLSTADKVKLQGANFTTTDIVNIEKDINAHGIKEVLKGITDPAQKQAIESVYGGGSVTKLNRESVSKLFGIPDDSQSQDTNGWWPGGHEVNATRLDGIMDTISKYQAVGYSDTEILKMMKSGG